MESIKSASLILAIEAFIEIIVIIGAMLLIRLYPHTFNMLLQCNVVFCVIIIIFYGVVYKYLSTEFNV